MAQLTCDLCGSTNLIKEEGVFVCQHCGAKYSVADAKKMMAEQEKAEVHDVAKPLLKKVHDKLDAAKARTRSTKATKVSPKELSINSAGEFDPAAVSLGVAGPQAVNNYACRAYGFLLEDYKAIEHPSEEQLNTFVQKAKECLTLLDGAALVDGNDHLQNLFIYRNCCEIESSLKQEKYWDQDEEGAWKHHMFPVSLSTKLAGQKESWSDKAKTHRMELQQQWLQEHPAEVELKLNLNRQIEALEAQLGELKDEKKSHGFFDFSGKREVKDRMKPVKDELSGLRKQVSAIDRACDSDIDAALKELESSFVRLDF